jgi:YD repeat-containing protein
MFSVRNWMNLFIRTLFKLSKKDIMKFRPSTLFIAFVALAVAAFTACNQTPVKKEANTGTAHYRTLLFSETPWDTERGSHELTPDQAKKINNYKFTYDDAGRLVSVEFVRGDELLGYGSLSGAAKIAYEYPTGKQVKRFFDENGQPIESDGVFTYEYTLDEKGTRTALRFLDKDGNPVENRNKIHNYVWNILPDGKLQEKRYNLANEETIMNPFCPFYELRFTYNDKGYVTEMANYMGDTLYNCTAENCGDIGVSYFTFESNDHGDLQNFSVYNVTGQMSNLYWGWSRRVSTYDENGYVQETAMFDQDNEYVAGKMIPVTRYKYDDHGALVETINMDKDRNIINHPDNGVAITRYEYDDKGNRTGTLRFDKDQTAVSQ